MTAKLTARMRAYVDTLANLMESPVSAQDVSHLTGWHLETARAFLKEMHRRKLVHIAQWDTTHNRRIKLPMYMLGERQDAQKPGRLPSALTTRRWKERKKLREQFDPFFAICRVAVPGEADQVRAVPPVEGEGSTRRTA